MTVESKKLVSVVIPCYNQAHFLGEAIESVLAQTYQHHEIVVVDDGSPDNTREVAARFKSVRYVYQTNQGLAASRNTGLRRSRGEYLVFLDSDDRLLPHALQTNLKHLESRPNCAFVSGRCNWVTSDGTPLPTPAPWPEGERDYYLLLLSYNNVGGPAAVMFRRKVFDSVVGFNTSLGKTGTEDYELYLRIARTFPIHCHGESVAEYRRHSASMSQNAATMLKGVLITLGSQRDYVKGNEKLENAYKSAIRNYKRFYGDRLSEEVRASVRASDWKRASRSAVSLLRYYPQGFARNAYRKLLCTLRNRDLRASKR